MNANGAEDTHQLHHFLAIAKHVNSPARPESRLKLQLSRFEIKVNDFQINSVFF
jgi:hypothetical protein